VSRGTSLALTAAVVSGALVAVQQRINGDLAQSLHDPVLAAVVSFGTGLLLLSCVLAVRRDARARVPVLSTLPWWWRLGGLGGATLVAVGAAAAPRIGVALLTIGLVAGSTLGGLAVDKAGFGPGGHHALTPPRLLGAGLCLVAIAVSVSGGVHHASPVLLALVFAAGTLIAVQQALNGRVRHATDPVVATFVNFVVGTAALLVGLGVRELLVGVQAEAWPGADRWWLYLGGPMGATFVAVAAVVVRRLGVLRLGLAVTAGQVLGGLALDLSRGVPAATVVGVLLTLVAVAVSGVPPRSVRSGGHLYVPVGRTQL
jgi:transporter family-2 protein